MHFAECTNDTEKKQGQFGRFTIDFAHLKRYSSKHQKDAARGRKELIMAKRYPNNKSIQMSFLFIEAREQITGLYYRAQKKRLSV